MTQITLEGIVGWDIRATDIRRQLAEADGPVELLIHSPGGSVFEGIAIHNAIRDHRRAGNEVSATVSGIAASMATYIAMAAHPITAEDNAVFMIHNASLDAWGDRRALQKGADILASIDAVLGRAYQAKTGRDARDEMDAETWLFGQEIVDAGYADALIPAGDGPDNRIEALAMARGSFESMTARLRQESKPDLDQIAALLPQYQPQPKGAVMATEKTAADPVEEPIEDTEENAGESDVEEIVQAAITAERHRVSQIQARCAQVGMPDLAAALIESGASLARADAAIVDAWVAKGGVEIRQTTASEKPPIDVAAAQKKLFNQVSGKV